MTRKTKTITISTLCIVLFLAIFMYFRYFYVFGEGIKAGNLNYIVYKGYIFKTYEGMLIQTGFKSKIQGTIQSNEFPFSVANDSLANKLMKLSGSDVQLHYKEYFAPFLWRGKSKYVVDKIENIYSTENKQFEPIN
ncbi:hypothetical protein HW49_10870 [Porphyromonadaceae bacterium COT-184 OH4590]|nr:hypothetical protein HW49_10870 [Porphyromonadaceae bacterium COT-184 OH4590]MDO4726446.1 hypothetical protein [Porphyromonadaceae bacterium]